MWSFKDAAEAFNSLDRIYRRLVFAILLGIIAIGLLLISINVVQGHHGRIAQWEYNLPDTVIIQKIDTVTKTIQQKQHVGNQTYNTEIKGPVDGLHIGDNN